MRPMRPHDATIQRSTSTNVIENDIAGWHQGFGGAQEDGQEQKPVIQVVHMHKQVSAPDLVNHRE